MKKLSEAFLIVGIVTQALFFIAISALSRNYDADILVLCFALLFAFVTLSIIHIAKIGNTVASIEQKIDALSDKEDK